MGGSWTKQLCDGILKHLIYNLPLHGHNIAARSGFDMHWINLKADNKDRLICQIIIHDDDGIVVNSLSTGKRYLLNLANPDLLGQITELVRLEL